MSGLPPASIFDIFISLNSGVAFADKYTGASLFGLAMTDDGTHIYTLINDYSEGSLFYSDDSGEHFSSKPLTGTGEHEKYGVVVSADGTKLSVADFYGNLWGSSDSGDTWALNYDGNNLSGYGVVNNLAASSDLHYQCFFTDSNEIVLSADYGATWTKTTPFSNLINAIDISDDGQIILVSTEDTIKLSSDGGVSWSDVGPGQAFQGKVSSTGQYMIIIGTATDYSMLYVSSDYGQTWTSVSPDLNFTSIAISGNGLHMAALTADGHSWIGS